MPNEAIYFPATRTVRFAIYPDGIQGARILAEISEHALRSVFKAKESPGSLIDTYKANFIAIQTKALARYARDPSTAICLEKTDFDHEGFLSRNGFIG